ncbi:uncharacterized protein TEOVI_000718600 [Trypanosoma equiperdum]|uniref:Uncharacterized protein n=2 Tax=Trypanozoon TaxID=39700 RepID=Q382K1_TRYB2|nr:hypothetical protein, conserved [Trypanosoma brucei brucei TREU927]EAN80280.1 hypothetical protein, conserved [Trypanosoma brucei brucei TREU927]SCU66299.1 hypothetical protein, conserved [Trypanosoma equiperdum]
MAAHDEGSTAESFIKNFFSVLDGHEASPAYDGEKQQCEDTGGPLLHAKQRKTLEGILPVWVRLLSSSSLSNPQWVADTNRLRPRVSGHTRADPFLTGAMADGWFNLSHLAPVVTPWAHPRPPEAAARCRVLRHLQRRYESAGRQTFVEELLKILRERVGGMRKTIRREDLTYAMEQIVAVTAGDVRVKEEGDDKWQDDRKPTEIPVELLADVLFSEWCSVAEGDASFTSTSVPLHVVEADLNTYKKADGIGCDDRGKSLGVSEVNYNSNNFSATVGMLSALACASPMTSKAGPQADAKQPLPPDRSKKRARDYDDDDDDEWEDDSEDGDEWENTSTTAVGGCAFKTFIANSTSTFDVPLASAVLSLYDVSSNTDGGHCGEVAPHVTQARCETYYRRGQFQWFVLGESKRHRSILESKVKNR